VTVLRVSRTHHPVTVLGHGVRAGLWVQGCTIGCDGCISQDTWPADGGADVTVDALVDWLTGLPAPLDGLTISGGEPFQQPEALAALLGAVRAVAPASFDVLVYSGYAWPRLERDAATAPALALCDAVIAGPFVRRRAGAFALRGSANQRVVTLTALGEERYGALEPHPRAAMQVGVEGDRLYCIGIPRPGDMDRMAEQLASAGIAFEGLTWRP
jgi:anaerobic ribonucleoside-triphosphate reductase activating protein